MRKADILLALAALILAAWLAITMVRRKTNFDFPSAKHSLCLPLTEDKMGIFQIFGIRGTSLG